MSINDPIGDLIARINNAQMRKKPKVSTPGSRLRVSVLDVLKNEGYIRGYADGRAHRRPQRARDRAEVFRRPAGDPRDVARLQAGPPRLRRGAQSAAHQQRSGRRDPVDAEGRDGRPRCARRQRRRRSALHGVLRHGRTKETAMSRIGKKAVPVPSGVTANVEGQTVKVKGPKGALQLVLHDDVIGQDGQGRDQGRSALRDQARALAVGHVAHAGQQPDDRRDQGLRGEARDHRRRLSRRGAGQEPAAPARLQPRRGLSDPGRHRDRDAEADRDHDHRHRTSRRSARWPPRSAISGRRSPTRARA